MLRACVRTHLMLAYVRTCVYTHMCLGVRAHACMRACDAARVNNERQFGLGGCPQAPPPPQDDPSLFELPPLIIDGIPTPVEKMTQAQLRAFIPLMLKYSMGRSPYITTSGLR